MRLFKLISSVNDLHALGIVHLDVKPSNFHGSTLLDYGLSTYSGLETSTKVATLNYKSPEVSDSYPSIFSRPNYHRYAY
jgi:serine/threonine protein kinase